MREFADTVKTVWFNIMPLGWIGWHPRPSLQWVVPSSGRWFIETYNGKRVEMGRAIFTGAPISRANSTRVGSVTDRVRLGTRRVSS
jgi:hypothetical protein